MRGEHGRLVICAQSVGYGPAGKALAVAERLRDVGVRPLLLGVGVAHELLARSEALGDAVEAAPGSERARAILAEAAAVLSVMDAGYGRDALDAGAPLYVADSLPWGRVGPVPVFQEAHRYWIQRWLEPLPAWCGTAAIRTVGPIVRRAGVASAGERRGFVVNLGGYQTPYASVLDDSGWAEFVVSGLVDAGVGRDQGSETLVMAGAACADTLRRRFGGTGLRFESLAHEAAHAAQERAAAVLTAPGLTTTLECFAAGTPTFFLPPQNYSQWRILARLREAGLAEASLHWSDVVPDPGLHERLELSERIPVVRGAIARGAASARARATFGAHLAEVARADGVDRAGLARRQGAFFASLGTNGAQEIASELAAALGGSEGSRESRLGGP